MTGKREYDDSCGMAQGLNFVGDRWSLHVVRELLLGPKRFADLHRGLPGISSNVLAQRLAELEPRGIVRRRRLPPPAAVWVYELTEWGAELEPIIIGLGSWAARTPMFDAEGPLSPTSAVLSMRTMFRREPADGVTLQVGLRLAELTVLAQVDKGGLDIVPVDALRAPGNPNAPDALVTTEPKLLAQLLFAGADLDEALDTGLVELEGDRMTFEHYLNCFRLPEAASGSHGAEGSARTGSGQPERLGQIGRAPRR